MSLRSRVVSTIEQQIGVIITLPVTLLITWVATVFGNALYPVITEILPPKTILPLLLLSLILNIALVFLLNRYRKKYVLRLAYGVYWNNKISPHCPHCKGPMTWGQQRRQSPVGYSCEPCNIVRTLRDNTGQLKTIDEVRAELKRN